MPIALLVVAAAAYPRLRAGAKAVLALFVGVVATVGGAAESGHRTVEVGPSGDDVSDFDVPTTIDRHGSSLYAVNARYGPAPTPTPTYSVVKVRR